MPHPPLLDRQAQPVGAPVRVFGATKQPKQPEPVKLRRPIRSVPLINVALFSAKAGLIRSKK